MSGKKVLMALATVVLFFMGGGVIAPARAEYDDTDFLQQRFDNANPGDVIVLPRVYHYSHSLKLTTPNVTVTGGGTLIATNEEDSSFLIDADNVTVTNLNFVSHSSRRWCAYEQMAIRLEERSGITITNVTVNGSAAAGIYVGGADHFLIDSVTISNTRADGLFITEGSAYGVVNNVTTRNTGDDGIAVVSYKDKPPVHHIKITNPVMDGQTWGRGFSVVGGSNITWRNVSSSSSSGAGIYVASEEEHGTHPSKNVRFVGGSLVKSNSNSAVDHGAVMVYNSNSGTVNNHIVFKKIHVYETGEAATGELGMVAVHHSENKNIKFSRISVHTSQTVIWSNGSQNEYKSKKVVAS